MHCFAAFVLYAFRNKAWFETLCQTDFILVSFIFASKIPSQRNYFKREVLFNSNARAFHKTQGVLARIIHYVDYLLRAFQTGSFLDSLLSSA